MLLARCCVKKAFKTARVCLIRHAPLKAFLYSPRIQNHYAKSGAFGFFKTNSEIVRIALLRSNGRKGRQPLQWKRPCRPLQWMAARAALALHPKALRQIGNWGFSERTPEVLANLSWEVRFFEGNGRGDRSIGEANLRKGRQPLLWKRHRCPLQWLAALPSKSECPFSCALLWRPRR